MESHGTSASTEGLVQKSGSRLAVGAAVFTLAIGAIVLVFSGASSPSDTTANSPLDPPPSTTTLSSAPLPTAKATKNTKAQSQTTSRTAPRTALPERGLFREALAGTLTAPCDDLIDGPEPVPEAYYWKHQDCVESALSNLDERCRLAATVFYVMPGDDALDIACDTQGETPS